MVNQYFQYMGVSTIKFKDFLKDIRYDIIFKSCEDILIDYEISKEDVLEILDDIQDDKEYLTKLNNACSKKKGSNLIPTELLELSFNAYKEFYKENKDKDCIQDTIICAFVSHPKFQIVYYQPKYIVSDLKIKTYTQDTNDVIINTFRSK